MFGNVFRAALVLTLVLSGCAESPPAQLPPTQPPPAQSPPAQLPPTQPPPAQSPPTQPPPTQPPPTQPPPAPGAQPMQPAGPDITEMVNAAKSAALAWLALVDEGRYPDSWDAASKLFQRGVSREDWQRAVASVRGGFGKRLSRQLEAAQFKTALPGVPDGKYVVFVFKSSFEHKAHATETITPMQEPDGSWKVSGYFVK